MLQQSMVYKHISVYCPFPPVIFLWIACLLINVGKGIGSFPFQKLLFRFSEIFGIFKYCKKRCSFAIYALVAEASGCIVLKYSTVR